MHTPSSSIYWTCLFPSSFMHSSSFRDFMSSQSHPSLLLPQVMLLRFCIFFCTCMVDERYARKDIQVTHWNRDRQQPHTMRWNTQLSNEIIFHEKRKRAGKWRSNMARASGRNFSPCYWLMLQSYPISLPLRRPQHLLRISSSSGI